MRRKLPPLGVIGGSGRARAAGHGKNPFRFVRFSSPRTDGYEQFHHFDVIVFLVLPADGWIRIKVYITDSGVGNYGG